MRGHFGVQRSLRREGERERERESILSIRDVAVALPGANRPCACSPERLTARGIPHCLPFYSHLFPRSSVLPPRARSLHRETLLRYRR